MKIRLSLAVIAIALFAIAANMTYANFAGQKAAPPTAQVEVREEIVQVIGRVTEVFDGIGADNGFLVTNGAELQFVHYDRGSMAAGPGWKPEYLKMVKFGNGETAVVPITVDQFH